MNNYRKINSSTSESALPGCGRKKHRLSAIVMALSLGLSVGLTGCTKTTTTTSKTAAASQTAATSGALSSSSMFTDRDLDSSYDTSSAVTVSLSDNGSTSSDDSVTIKDNTITITKEGTYVIRGSLSAGQIIVNAKDSAKVQLVLDNASITNDTSAAIYVKNANKVFVTLADGSTNTLSTTGTFKADGKTNVDGVVFSKSDRFLR